MHKLSKLVSVGSNFVRESMFGGNYTFHNDFDQSNPEGNSMPVENLTASSVLLGGVNTWRYPGGAVAEKYFDIFNWNSSVSRDGTEVVTPLNQFFGAVGQGGQIAIVIPTVPGLMGGAYGERDVDPDYVAQVAVFVQAVLEMAAETGVEVTAFELGNEFWGHEMSGAEYGTLAAKMAKAVQDAQDTYDAANGNQTGEQASILVQSTVVKTNVSDNPLTAHQELRELTDSFLAIGGAVAAIDGVVDHFYAKGFDIDEGAQGFFFDQMQRWENRAGKELEWHVTEWNYHNGSGSQGAPELRGLKQATLMVEMMYRMVNEGVDVAQVWPVWSSKLTSTAMVHSATTKSDPSQHELSLKHSGASFMMMNESIIGLSVAGFGNLSTDTAALLEYHAFSNNQNRDVIFISNQSASTHEGLFDFSDFVASYGDSYFVSLKQLGDDAAPDADYETMVRSKVVLTGQSWNGLELSERNVQLSLQDWELARLEITDITENGDTITGSLGNDTIDGLGGADSIDAGDGNDNIRGGNGSDTLVGGDGNDFLSGNLSSDSLVGGVGNDTLLGGRSGDSLVGGTGEDLLRGQSGADTLSGGEGNDTVDGGEGDDLLSGGAGKDTFVFSGYSGHDVISDFDSYLDQILIDGNIFDNVAVDGYRFNQDRGGLLLEMADKSSSVLLEGIQLEDLLGEFEPLISLPVDYFEQFL